MIPAQLTIDEYLAMILAADLRAPNASPPEDELPEDERPTVRVMRTERETLPAPKTSDQ